MSWCVSTKPVVVISAIVLVVNSILLSTMAYGNVSNFPFSIQSYPVDYLRDFNSRHTSLNAMPDRPTIQTLKDLCIFRRAYKNKTKRGTTAGKRKKQQPPFNKFETIRENNLILIKTTTHSDTLTWNNQRNNHYTHSKTHPFKIILLNARSCRNKTTEIHNLISDSHADICLITETWFKPGDEPLISDLTPSGYKTKSNFRTNRPGGGTAIIYRDSLKISTCNIDASITSFEHTTVKVATSDTTFVCSCVYRPPTTNTSTSLHSQSGFLNEFTQFIELLNAEKHVLITGDFNLHVDSLDNPLANHFLTLLNEHHLTQLVEDPTHIHGHTLDLVITRKDSNIIHNIDVDDKRISDHFLITFAVRLQRPKPRKGKTVSRNVRNIDIDVFKKDLSTSLTETSPLNVVEFNDCLSSVLDKHAPLQERYITKRTTAPWMNADVIKAKQHKRKAERAWKKSGLNEDKLLYDDKKKRLVEIINNEKKKHLNERISGSVSTKELFRVCNSLLGKNEEQSLPNDIALERLPETFNSLFLHKIETIRNKLDESLSEPEFVHYTGPPLSNFRPVSESEIEKVILNSPRTSCELDPLPADLLIECLDILLPYITSYLNDSLEKGHVPQCFKNALVKPLLKKPNLDHNNLKNYRPVSNLPFLSKVFERLVLDQIENHINHNDLNQKFQSAYKKKHSTETALLKVTSDLLSAADSGKVSILTLLDLSAAFDTIDHPILLKRLDKSFGLRGSVYEWLASYLRDRQQQVVVGAHKSDPIALNHGVPQGSVLGPILFSLYSQSLMTIIQRHNFHCHCYADDTQIYKSVTPTNCRELFDSLKICINDVSDWMIANKLKLNEDKTEIMIVGSKTKVSKINLSSLKFGDHEIEAKSNVKNLGIILDSNLSMAHHVSHLVKICFLELRRISHIRQFLTPEATNKLVCAFVLSRLDYCNSLFTGLPSNLLLKLQKIQNHAARLVLNTPKREHVTPILKSLHWLPLKYRINYKIANIIYQCLNDSSFPSYITDLIQVYNPKRTLRSSNTISLESPRVNLKSYGERSFNYQGPKTWNNLPVDLRNCNSFKTFKRNLKTDLFKSAYCY